MKHVKCNVLSEFDGTINGQHISDKDLYYTTSLKTNRDTIPLSESIRE